MKEEIKGVVIQVKDETASVRVSRHSDCSSCGLCPGENAMMMEASNDIGAKPGQRVVVIPKQSHMLRAAFIVFILPIMLLLLGAFLGYEFFLMTHDLNKNTLIIIGGSVFLVISLLMIRHFDSSMSKKKDIPQIARIIN